MASQLSVPCPGITVKRDVTQTQAIPAGGRKTLTQGSRGRKCVCAVIGDITFAGHHTQESFPISYHNRVERQRPRVKSPPSAKLDAEWETSEPAKPKNTKNHWGHTPKGRAEINSIKQRNQRKAFLPPPSSLHLPLRSCVHEEAAVVVETISCRWSCR